MANKDINKDKKKNNFFKELRVELKKVTWPTFKKLVNDTSTVISIVLIVAIIVFVLDVCFENLNKLSVGKLQSFVSSNSETSEETEDSTDSNDGVDIITDDGNEIETGVEEGSDTEQLPVETEVAPEQTTESEEVTQ